MKTIGLIGGMSWESSKLYYEILNQEVKERLGGLHSAKCMMYSFDFEPIKQLQFDGKWDEAAEQLKDAARRLENSGVDFILLCTNTMHKLAEQIESNIGIPFLHIADATGQVIQNNGLKKVGLLATRFTMEEPFYKERLEQRYGLEVIIPGDEDRNMIHEIIYQELCRGEIKESSKKEYRRVIQHLIEQGAEGIILGCTEITLLIKQEDCEVPVFDTTYIHAVQAVEFALES
ncbi:aspartate/glutamate racemase family protein [Ammoniphilus sp. CFH 90114]|uniref:aspartate/glutamate racemase family protein n=1 Tax=Ammoniphilus sp. CFH 90114 TaxID=2493665 RepID=UPI00100DDC70|nr:aspartate/glutamate racemase family protein [Ammoniphilus sp. CFH 90114]RXT02299.1 aspartate/glutamate racemase family protein [Ammoniphilus sp. CFH 90114]